MTPETVSPSARAGPPLLSTLIKANEIEGYGRRGLACDMDITADADFRLPSEIVGAPCALIIRYAQVLGRQRNLSPPII